jgi:2-hydroxychromene-2-carboxylate isomerase
MARTLEFYFDFMSPYSYLASTRIEGVVQRTGATLSLKPLYLPGVLRATGNKSPIETPSKAMYTLKDLNDWAKHYRLPEVVLPEVFPFAAAQADRVAIVVTEVAPAKALPFFLAMFNKVWVERVDANAEATIAPLLKALELDAPAIIARAQTEELKAKLRANTEQAVERGAFGVPTFFVGDQMFVGNDRLHFVEEALNASEKGTP